jgi:excisionase family DNA binding protein
LKLTTKKLVVPTPEESKLARETFRKLTAHRSRANKVDLLLSTAAGRAEHAAVPKRALELLAEILRQTAEGNAVAVLPVHQELTTQEAADLMNVSRPFLIALVEKGELPARKVGSHRRIPLAALLALKSKTDANRDEGLNFLAERSQTLKLGY